MITDHMIQKALIASGMPIDTKHTNAEVEELADAMWQLLDDMKKGGLSVCLCAKAQARVAYEPFRDKSEPEYDDWMSLEQANQILEECGG
jgi:hypothetical protein